MPAGIREGVAFLRQWLPPALAHKAAQRYGPGTRAAVLQDPYAALAPLGVPFAKLDSVAAAMGAPADLVSRGAMALSHCLLAAAAEDGHTYLPWDQLQQRAGKLLAAESAAHGAPWYHTVQLHLVAQHMQSAGLLVAEPAAAAAPEEAEPQASAAMQLDDSSAGSGLSIPGDAAAAAAADSMPGAPAAAAADSMPSAPAAATPLRTYPELRTRDQVKAYLVRQISGVGEAHAESMLVQHREAILRVLDLPFQVGL